MADINSTETNLEQNNVPDASQELASSMALALGQNVPQNNTAEIVADNVTAGNTQETVVDTAEQQVTQIATEYKPFFDKFGYASIEDAVKEVESLRAFKENPVQVYELPNEESRQLFDAIKAGKKEQVLDILAQQAQIEKYISQEVTEQNAEDIIRLGMKLKYKEQGLSDDDINYKIKKQFSIPKEPVQAASELDEDFEERLQEWKEKAEDVKREKLLEAKMMKPEIASKKADLVLPDEDSEVDAEYEAWKESQKVNQETNTKTIEAYRSLTPKSVETRINFNDEANKINFDFQYEPSDEDFKKAVDIVSDFNNKFFAQFIDKDGNPDRKEFLRRIDFMLNPQKVITEAIKQSKNATLRANLPNNNGNSQRQIPQTMEVSDLDANMNRALNGYRRN